MVLNSDTVCKVLFLKDFQSFCEIRNHIPCPILSIFNHYHFESTSSKSKYLQLTKVDKYVISTLQLATH